MNLNTLAILVKTVIVITVVESLIMGSFALFSGYFTHLEATLFDVFFLSLLSAPFLYQFVISPFVHSEEKLRRQLKERNNIFSTYVIASNADLNGFITYASKALCEISGYTQEELIGKPHSVLRHPDTLPRVFENMWKTIKSGKQWEGELKNKKKDGDFYWVKVIVSPTFDTEGNIIGYSSVRHDITEQKSHEEKVALSRSRFETMFSQAPLGIALIDSYTGDIFEVNKKFASIIGRTIDDMKKSIDWMSITHPDDIQEDLNHMALLNRGEILGFNMQKRYIHKDGSFVWIDMTISPMKIEANESPRHLCMIHDITKRKKDEEILRNHIRKAQTGEMVSVIAHEWKQPLGALAALNANLNVTLELGNDIDKNSIQNYCAKVESTIESMISIMDDFRHFNSPNQEVVDVNVYSLINNSIILLKGSVLNKNIDIKNLSDKSIIIGTYKNEIMQVFVNILKNYIDIVDERKIIDPEMEINTIDNDNSITITFQDNGGGIPEKVINKVFESYFTTKSKEKGTGLGLYMSKLVIEEHCNGEIFVENKNNGALFSIILNK